MKYVGLSALLTMGLIAFACGGDDSTSSTSNSGPSSGSGNTTSSGGSGGSSSNGNGGSTSTNTGAGGNGSGGTTGAGGGDPCAMDPGDDACTACIKSNCCADVTACAADPVCTCLVDCFEMLPAGTSQQQAVLQCSQQCNVSPANIPTAAYGLYACGSANGPCGNSCMQ